jgi:hypothetical protein
MLKSCKYCVSPGKVQHIFEDFLISLGRDDHNPKKAANLAINNIENQ